MHECRSNMSYRWLLNGTGSVPLVSAKRSRQEFLIRLVDAVRTANWLTAERARTWSRVLAVIIVSVAILWVGLTRHGVDPMGKPLGTDFLSFWTAAQLASA